MEKENSLSKERFIIEDSIRPLSCYETLKRIGVKGFLNIFFLRASLFKVFLTNFLLVYNVRAGITLLVRMLGLLRSSPSKLFSLKDLLNEANYRTREEAVRTGLIVGLFTATYRSLFNGLGEFNFLRYYFALKDNHNKAKELDKLKSTLVKREPWHSAVSGFVAGFSLLIMDKSWHRSLALYMATRGIQSAYNYNKIKGYFHFWGSHWQHGDSLLFALSSAQVMYAYAMRPKSLPDSYYRFILKNGPYTDSQLQFIRDSNRQVPLDVPKFLQYVIDGAKGNVEIIKKVLPFVFVTSPRELLTKQVDFSSTTELIKSFTTRANIQLIPLQALHTYTTSKLLHVWNSFANVLKVVFPIYLSLVLVPATVLRFNHFVKMPLTVLTKSLMSAVRSTIFLAAFCGSYQALITLQRIILEAMFFRKLNAATSVQAMAAVQPKDARFTYWIAGFFCSAAILIEKKSRRSELGLYVFPRAVDSLFLILLDRKLFFAVPHGELLLFSSAMGTIMYFYENHPETLSPLLKSVLSRFLDNTIVFKEQAPLRDLASETSI